MDCFASLAMTVIRAIYTFSYEPAAGLRLAAGASFSMKIGSQPGIVRFQQFGDWPGGDDPPLAERGDTIADRIETVEIMRHHED